jgi:hypothetical protein
MLRLRLDLLVLLLRLRIHLLSQRRGARLCGLRLLREAR